MISQTGYLLGITEQTCVINSGLNVDQVRERQLDLGIEKRWTNADQLKWARMAFRSQSTCQGWLPSHIRHSPSPITLACQGLLFRIASQTWCVVNGASYIVVSKQQIFSPGPMAFPWLFWPTFILSLVCFALIVVYYDENPDWLDESNIMCYFPNEAYSIGLRHLFIEPLQKQFWPIFEKVAVEHFDVLSFILIFLFVKNIWREIHCFLSLRNTFLKLRIKGCDG